MQEHFNLNGKWFLPGQFENHVVGTLEYTPAKGITLSLSGLLYKKREEFHDPELINGITSDGKYVTLYKCFSIEYKFNSSSYATSKYDSLYLFIGFHFTSIDQLIFQKIACELADFDLWVRQYGFKKIKCNDETNEISIDYQRPTDIEYEINSNLQFRIRFNATYPIGPFGSSASIVQTTGINLSSIHGPETFEKLLAHFYTFYRLMTLAYFKEPLINRLSATLDNGDKYPPVIDIYYKIETTEDNYKHINTERLFLFGYRPIKNNFGHILNKWFELSEILEPSFSGLAESFTTKKYAVELRFLNLAQALESLHRRTDKNTYKTKEHKEKVKAIVENIPEEFRPWLKEKLSYSHEPVLSDRLLTLAERLPYKVKNVLFKPSQIEFLDNIKNSRNYYTHYNEKLKGKTLFGTNLFQLSERMKIFLLCLILKEIDFNDEEIENVIFEKGGFLFNHLIDRSEFK